MATRSYATGEVSVIIGGFIIKGRKDLVVSHPNDRYTESLDIDGGLTSVENSSWRFCEITLTMEQGSTDNGTMSTLFTAGATVPVIIKDNKGNDVHSVAQARIRKLPDAGYGAETADREWTLFGMAELSFVGGNN